MKCDTSHPAFYFKVKNILLKSAELGALDREIPVTSSLMTRPRAKNIRAQHVKWDEATRAP